MADNHRMAFLALSENFSPDVVAKRLFADYQLIMLDQQWCPVNCELSQPPNGGWQSCP